ncbi:MAG: hypothetical protein COC19_04220 [SAR86 cluster bacterium]|uniref:histidine kinase n=1 Tax=SAR86 cluster bacterium TaxID=2030880 RepID=A0A2A4MP12_9GAMM|nr:MAG: hypothetical protein COC19_04220 [SAR86 cluster bacterium]
MEFPIADMDLSKISPPITFGHIVDQYLFAIILLLIIFSGLAFFILLLKKRLSSLESRSTLLEAVMNSIPDAVFLSDNNASIFSSNRAAQSLFDYDEKETIGMDLLRLSTDDLSTTDSELKIFIFQKNNGESFPGEKLTCEIQSEQGNYLGQLTLIRDVSIRLHQQEMQSQLQKMSELGKLVKGFSHELNNVLGVISGYVQLSLATLGMKSPEANLNNILKATMRSKNLIGQISAFIPTSSDEQNPLDLCSQVKQGVFLSGASDHKNITTTFVEDDSQHRVLGSPTQLQQLVCNLVENSCWNLQESGGTINIEINHHQVTKPHRLSHGLLTAGNYSVLSITDNGSGIADEHIAKVFEPFYTTKQKGEGPGLGLSIAYNHILAHGACLNLATESGSGTTFSIYFNALENNLAVNAQ